MPADAVQSQRRSMSIHDGNANPRAVRVSDAADRRILRYEVGVVELDERWRESLHIGRARRVVPEKPHVASTALEASHHFGGVGCSMSRASTPIRAANSRATSAHTPFNSPVTGSLVYWGGNSASRTLPACTRSATRESGTRSASAIDGVASRTRLITETQSFRVMASLFLGERLRLTHRVVSVGKETLVDRLLQRLSCRADALVLRAALVGLRARALFEAPLRCLACEGCGRPFQPRLRGAGGLPVPQRPSFTASREVETTSPDLAID